MKWYGSEFVILIRCAKVGVTRVGLIQKGKTGYGEGGGSPLFHLDR